MTEASDKVGLEARNRRTARVAGGIAACMLLLAFASVPLYRLFCQATGYAGTPQRATQSATTITDRIVTVRFDANVGPGLPWRFEPVSPTLEVRVGETTLAHYRATNISDRTTVGSATFNVAPDIIGGYFNKLECFCFTEQRLAPGESVDMAVSFFLDPAMLRDAGAEQVATVTLSYTFFPVDHPKTGDAGVKTDPSGAGKGT